MEQIVMFVPTFSNVLLSLFVIVIVGVVAFSLAVPLALVFSTLVLLAPITIVAFIVPTLVFQYLLHLLDLLHFLLIFVCVVVLVLRLVVILTVVVVFSIAIVLGLVAILVIVHAVRITIVVDMYVDVIHSVAASRLKYLIINSKNKGASGAINSKSVVRANSQESSAGLVGLLEHCICEKA